MRSDIIKGALLGILLLGFTVSGMALAEDDNRGCSNLGTWFGVFAPGDTRLSGYSVTVMGNSELMGTNHFEFPNFDPSFQGVPELQDQEPFASAKYIGSMRGNWKRIGKNRFAYTFMGFAFDEFDIPVYIGKVSGETEIFGSCEYERVTAVMEVYLPWVSPFNGEWIAQIPLGEFYGYRAKVELPY
jgi:hypothetical protein